MKRITLVCLFLFLASSILPLSACGAFELLNAKDMVRMRDNIVKSGLFPVFVNVVCEDTETTNKLRSLVTSDLRKKDNVKVVLRRQDACLWLNIEAIKSSDSLVSVSYTFGYYNMVHILSAFGISSRDIYFPVESDLAVNGKGLWVSPLNQLGWVTSAIADAFDVNCVEHARAIREEYIADEGKKKFKGLL